MCDGAGRTEPIGCVRGRACRALIALIIASMVCISHPGRGDELSHAPRSGGSALPRTGVQQATHTDVEPARLATSSSERPLALPAPSREPSGERGVGGSRTLGAIVSVLVSLGIVLGLFFLIAWLMKRGLPTAARRLPSEVVEVLGRAPLAGRQQMHVLRFGNKLLLVCASPSGVDTLGEITDPVEIDRVAGLCQQTEPFSATSAFKQVLGQLAREKPTRSIAVLPSGAKEATHA